MYWGGDPINGWAMNEMQYQIDLISAMNEKLKREQKMMELIIDTSTSAFIYYNYEHDDLRVLGCFDKFFSFQIKRINELHRIIDAVDTHYRDSLIDCFNIDTRGESSRIIEVLLTESRKWIEFSITVVYDSNDKRPTDKIIRMKDVTKATTQNEELSYMAYYDIMTGLYNRNYFIKLLTEMIEKAKNNNKQVDIMFVDIDDFRQINDGMGIVVGDELMMNFGQFLDTLCDHENVVAAHFNGDLFCLGIYDPKGTTAAEYLYDCIRRRTLKPFLTADKREIFIKITAGVAEYPDASDNVLELINCAEIVMMRAKHNGKDSIQYFDSDILSEFLLNVSVENKLREAVFDMNFMIYYQPQYNAETGELRGVEALIRWKDADQGMISPSVFIPIAEKNGTIVPIGNWVIEESIRTYMRWRNEFDRPFLLSINISAIQYKRDDFVERLIHIIEKYKMPPSELELEITETALIDNYRDVIGKLSLLREYGVRISMDDFGTGYSSLSYLKSLPIDTLKIDKTFVDSVLDDKNSIVIMESIMFMVKRLGLETVAEGVETKEQLDYLKSIKCDNIQGFLLGRPQSEEGIKQLLNDRK